MGMAVEAGARSDRRLWVGEVARLVGVHPNTLRRWCRRELVTSWVSTSGWRFWRQNELGVLRAEVARIKALRG